LLVRRIAIALAATAVTLSLSACSLGGNVASLDPYSPSDGQQVDLESVKARNLIYLVGESGRGFLIGSLVSSSTSDIEVKLQYVDPATDERTDYFFYVPAGAKVDFGYNGNPAVELPVVETPGQTAKFYLVESENISGLIQVPVLDGTLAEYQALLEQLEAQQPVEEAEEN
jgi:hypothetical protein